MRLEIRNWLINITNAVMLVIMLFLVLRVLFRLFSANPQTPFVSWVYDVSGFLMTPFRGIFGSISIAQTGVLDVPALFTIFVYALIGMLAYYLIRILTARLSHEEMADEDVEEHRHARSEHAHVHSR